MDDHFGIVRGVTRFVAWFAVEVVYEIGFALISVMVGRFTLLTFTFGNYPSKNKLKKTSSLLDLSVFSSFWAPHMFQVNF
jgi:predicted amino acid-binding ACT domain protein